MTVVAVRVGDYVKSYRQVLSRAFLVHPIGRFPTNDEYVSFRFDPGDRVDGAGIRNIRPRVVIEGLCRGKL